MKTSSRLLASALAVLATAAPAEWRHASPDYTWSFPEDHWARDGFKTEWWYFTGHLQDQANPSRQFGYQFTVFRVGVLPEQPDLASQWTAKDVFMGHAAVTDLNTGEHVFSEILFRAVPPLATFGRFPDSMIAQSRAAPGDSGTWALSRRADGFRLRATDRAQTLEFDLTVQPLKPLVFQGPNGYSRKNRDDGASMYYSLTRLGTIGHLQWRDERLTVRGESWMDKEFGTNQLSEDQQGWDWFALRLDDGRDFMGFVIRDSAGAVGFAHATVISPVGVPTFVADTAWSVTPTRRWRSDATDASYPVAWSLRVPDHDLTVQIEAAADAQENVSRLVPDLFYWEGAVDVVDETGRDVGRGFVEMTGYGTARKPAI